MSKSKDEPVDGAKVAAEIISRMEPKNRARVVQAIKEQHPEIAVKIEASLLTFEAIKELTPQGVQRLVKEVDQEDLILSFKKASNEVKEALLQNMSQRKREIVEAELSSLPPVKVSQVEQAQRKILEKLEELRSQGQIKTQGKKDVWV